MIAFAIIFGLFFILGYIVVSLFILFQVPPSNPLFVTPEKWVSEKWQLQFPQPHKKVCVFCYETRVQSGLTQLKEINEKYCHVNDYTFLYISETGEEEKYPPYWIKVKLAYDLLLSKKYEYICWIDSDVVIHDTEIRIESIFSAFTTHQQFIIKSTDNDRWFNSFNAGVWLVKTCPQAIEFFQDWIQSYPTNSWRRFKNNKWICTTCQTYANGPEYEQGAGTRLLESEKYKSSVITLDWRILQGYDIRQVQNIGFTLHFSGDFKNYMYSYLKSQSHS